MHYESAQEFTKDTLELVSEATMRWDDIDVDKMVVSQEEPKKKKRKVQTRASSHK